MTIQNFAEAGSGADRAVITVARYDADKLAELVAHEGRVREDLNEVSKRIAGEFNDTDKVADEAGTRAHEQLVLRHAHLSRERANVLADIDRMERSKPVDPKSDAYNTPRARWARGGAKALSGEERQAHVVVGQSLAHASLPNVFGKNLDGHEDGVRAEDIEGVRLPTGSYVDVEWFFEAPEAIRPGAEPRATVRSDQSPGGQDWTPEPLFPSLQYGQTLKLIGGVLGRTSEQRTRHGLKQKYGTLDDTGEEGEWFGSQVGPASDGDYTPDGVEMGTQIHSSKKITVGLAFEQDTPYNTDMLTRTLMDRRHYRALDKAIVAGDGANDTPRGLMSDAVVGVTTAANTGFTADELVSLIATVDIAYLMGEGSPYGLNPPRGAVHVGWGFNQATVGLIRLLKGGDNHYLWRPGLAGLQYADPPTIAGFPYVVDNNIATVAAGARVGFFGNLGYYMKRMAGPRIVGAFFDSGTASAYGRQYISFVRAGGRFVGGFADPAVATPLCEAVKALRIKT